MEVRWYERILPQLMAEITRSPRYKVDIQWHDTLLSFNLFRLYEFFFWRRVGIREEGASGHNEDGSEWHISYSYENAIVRREEIIRAWVRSFLRVLSSVRITVPILVTPQGQWVFGSSYVFAINIDLASGFTAYSDTLAHTVTGSNPFLYVQDVADSGTLPASWTCVWNTSESLTGQSSIDSDAAGADRWHRIWLLGAPSTGTHNIVAANTGTNFHMLGAISYSGAQSSSTMDSGSFTVSGTGAGTVGFTTTVVASNCWLVGFCNYTIGSMTVGTVRGSAKDNEMNGDSGATVGTGSQGLTWNKFGTAAGMAQGISFAPFGGGAVAAPYIPGFLLVGVG